MALIVTDKAMSQHLQNRPWGLVEPWLHVELLCFLQHLDSLFTSHSIPYWICGGTLLGAIRHGGFIPHDDDIDLEVFAHDLERVRDLCASEPDLTFTNRTRYYDKQFGKIFFKARKELVVDLFWREDPCPLEPEFLAHEEVFPIKRYDFHDIQVNGPGSPEAYLRRCYGQDYLTHCKVWTHYWNKQFTLGFSKDKEVVRVQDYLELCRTAGYMPVKLCDLNAILQTTAAAAAATAAATTISTSVIAGIGRGAVEAVEAVVNGVEGDQVQKESVLPEPVATPQDPPEGQRKNGSD